jgi:inositol-pentakisphosphate 2-kinase
MRSFKCNSRTKKDINSRRVIVSPDCVFLTDDHERNTSGDTLSFEIKPKQGWHSLKATCAVDLCHRCLKQHAKLYRGEIDSISRYCPLDLFSGDMVRMKRALFDLFEAPCNRYVHFSLQL